MSNFFGLPRRSSFYVAVLVVCAALAVVEANWDSTNTNSANRRTILNKQIITPNDPKKPLTTGAIIGISFAAAMAGLLLIGVLTAIFVPGVRHLVATNSGGSHPSLTQRSVLSNARSAHLAHSAHSSGGHGGATSPRNGNISTTSSDSESSEEVPMKKVKSPKAAKKSSSAAKKTAPPPETSDESADSNYDSV